MALTIYGSPRSRTMRVLWMAEEVALAYEHVPVAWSDPWLKSPEFLRINPAGAIPAIVDDGFALSESLAINLYLAKKFGRERGLASSSIESDASALRWTLWAQGHLEPWVQRDATLAEARAALADHALPWIARQLRVLDAELARDGWLGGARFTVADLNVAGVLSPTRSAQLDLSKTLHVRNWLARCYARPAAVAVRARFAEFVERPIEPST